ncbi:MAG: AraC family ligand binding domain-containing protein [Deltaproteobacteria bacterium]|nr:MAG: AraC family ligand binding domain-containing protein [Deltaproteobacteria bacterium]
MAFWGEHFDAESLKDTHQLIYLIEGDRFITLKDKDYEVVKGAGTYLEPSERVSIRPAGRGTLRLFHLIVPKIHD